MHGHLIMSSGIEESSAQKGRYRFVAHSAIHQRDIRQLDLDACWQGISYMGIHEMNRQDRKGAILGISMISLRFARLPRKSICATLSSYFLLSHVPP